MPLYKQFKVRNPAYDADYWAKCRAFYAGGKRLLGDANIMKETFPKHLSEASRVYDERVKRAYYIPYAGEIINSIIASLFSDPFTVSSEPKPADQKFYEAFFEDVSPEGGCVTSLTDLMKEQVTTAMLCKRAWTLVDLPKVEEGTAPPATLDEQQKQGGLNAYAVSVAPEMVLDWEETEDGELQWALVANISSKRAGLDSDRDVVQEVYTFYTDTTWERYIVTYKHDDPPKDEQEVPLAAKGQHSFGAVPLIPLELPDGLWAMGKILDIAIAHFNKRNALSWAEYKSLFPVLVSYKAAEDPLNPITADPHRDTNQTVGQGYVLGMGEKDRIEFLGPDAAPFTAAMADLSTLRDEMHRVLHSMALSVDNSGAAMSRSAESKMVDQAAAAIILKALGEIVHEHVIKVYELVQTGRAEELVKWLPEGMESFDEVGLEGLLKQAETVDTVSIPSARFKQLWTYQLARRLLGHGAENEDLALILKELKTNITNEQFDPTMAPIAEVEGGDGEAATPKKEPAKPAEKVPE